MASLKKHFGELLSQFPPFEMPIIEQESKVITVNDKGKGMHNSEGLDVKELIRLRKKTLLSIPKGRNSNNEFLRLDVDVLVPAPLEEHYP